MKGLPKARCSRLDQELERLGAGAFLVLSESARDPDLAPFVGSVHVHRAFFVYTPDRGGRLGYFTPMERDEAAATGLDLLTPEALDLARWSRDTSSEGGFMGAVLTEALRLCGGPRTVALAGRFPTGILSETMESLRRSNIALVDGNPSLKRVRQNKTAEEIQEIKKSVRGVDDAMRAIASLLGGAERRQGELWLEGERLKVARLRREVASQLAGRGLSEPEGNIIAPAEEGAVPHSAGQDERVIREGESLVVDLYPKGALFADCTRTFCVGQQSEVFLRSFALVRSVLGQITAGVHPGVTGWSLQEKASSLFEEEGFATPLTHPGTTVGYVHGLGHGVGYELHEFPTFRRAEGSEGTLSVGDVVTIEPGLYDKEARYGIRLEDLVVVTATGSEVLTTMPLSWNPCHW